MKLRRNSVLALGLLGASVMACGSDPGPGPKTPPGPKDAKGQPNAPEAANPVKNLRLPIDCSLNSGPLCRS